MKLSTLPLLVLLAACASTHGQGKSGDTKDPAPKAPIGRVLTVVDLNLRTWNGALLDEPTPTNLKLVEGAENAIGKEVLDRFEEFTKEMESGTARNRLIATAALGFSKDERALPHLVRAMNGEDPEIASNALMSLGVLASAATPIGPVLEALAHSPNPQARNQAAFLVVRICRQIPRDPDLVTTLRKALRDPEPGVRAQAAAALGKLRDSDSTDALVQLLTDAKPLIASAAAFALGEIADPKARDPLVVAMESSSPRVRDAAHRALIAIFGKDQGSRSWDWKSSK